jgi:hypothetical protein
MTINANSHDPAPRTPAEQARRNTALAAAKAAAGANSVADIVIPSVARTVGRATPENKLRVFGLQANELMSHVRKGVLDQRRAVDALQEIAESNGLIERCGQDEIRAVMSAAAVEPPPKIKEGVAIDQLKLDSATPPQQSASLPLWWHGEADANIDRAWLVEGLLPEIGTSIMSGAWGSYKTFVALDLALSLMRRDRFAGRAVNKQCGALFIAAEGAFEVPVRLQGAYEAGGCDSHSRLPFASADQCPRLLDKNALAILEATAMDAARRIRSEHGLDLGVIIIDTMAAAAGFDDENSNSEAQRVMNVLTALAHRFRCLVLVVDHFGKAAETGTRGGSAKEGSADAVLALLADRDLSGNVTNPRMAVRKVRGAPTGNEVPFDKKVVDLGLDKNGNPQTTLIIQWKQEGAAVKKLGTDIWPRPLHVFQTALWNVLAEHGIEQRPFSDGPVVRAVDTELVRSEFYRRYPADGDTEEKRQEARRKAYNRNLHTAQQRHLIGVAVVDKTTIIWCAKAGSNRDPGRDGQDKTLLPVLSVPPSAMSTDTFGTDVPDCPVPPTPPDDIYERWCDHG